MSSRILKFSLKCVATARFRVLASGGHTGGVLRTFSVSNGSRPTESHNSSKDGVSPASDPAGFQTLASKLSGVWNDRQTDRSAYTKGAITVEPEIPNKVQRKHKSKKSKGAVAPSSDRTTRQEGETANGAASAPHRRPDGIVEEGTWLNEGNQRKLHGEGKRTFPDSTAHVGTFYNGKLDGQGVITYPDGSTLEGEFRAGKPYYCKGTLRQPSGDVDEGEWVEGRLTGEGKRAYHDGKVQMGTFHRGSLHGQGVVTNADGSTLSGEFREGKIYNGKGILRHPDGTVEEGEWVNGELTGQCKRTFADGSTFEGEFREGKPYIGKGTLRHLDGTVEMGEWVNGDLTGGARRTYAEGRCEEGVYLNHKLHGQGMVTHPDGHRLEGEFREGKIYNGKGTLRHPKGDVEEGTWVEGNLTGKRI